MLTVRLFGERARDVIAALVPCWPRPGRLLALLEKLDRGLVISIAPIRRRRSLKQNRLYFGWLRIIGEDLGYDEDELEDLHYQLKGRLLGTRQSPLGPVPLSTKKLSTMDFGDYLKAVQRWAVTEHDIVLPDPEEWEAWEAARNATA
jgi:hypothetical protein